MKTKHHVLLLPSVLLTALLIFLSAAGSAHAELRRYILEYENTSGTRAQARGYIVIDDNVLNHTGSNDFPGDDYVKEFSNHHLEGNQQGRQRAPSGLAISAILSSIFPVEARRI